MLPISMLAPAALLVMAGLACWSLSLLNATPHRALAAAAAWLALAMQTGIWLAGRTAIDVTGPALGAGVKADFRLDALANAFVLMVLFPGAVLLSTQRRGWAEAGAASLALAAAVLAIEAAAIPLTALALGAAGVLLMLPLRAAPDAPQEEVFSLWQAVAWLAVLAAAAGLLALAGTAAYSAIPVTAFSVPVYGLLAGGAVLVAGMTPWRSWLIEAAARAGLPSAAISVAAVPPIGFYLLLRAYNAAGGRYPSQWLGVALSLLGLAVALGAGMRAQAAARRPGLVAELLVVNYGLALFALGLGTPLAFSAAVTLLLGTAVLVAMAPGLATAGPRTFLVALLAAAAAPPGLLFGGRLVAAQAGLESAGAGGVGALVAAAAWTLSIAAAARGAWLPADAGEGDTGSRLPAVLAAGLFAAGTALGAVETGLAGPAAVEVTGGATLPVGGGLSSVSTVSGGWPALAFGAPLVVLGAMAVVFAARRAGVSVTVAAAGGRPPPAPLVPAVWPGAAGRLGRSLVRMAVPADLRSMVDPRALDAAVSAGRPALWILVVAALAYVITR